MDDFTMTPWEGEIPTGTRGRPSTVEVVLNKLEETPGQVFVVRTEELRNDTDQGMGARGFAYRLRMASKKREGSFDVVSSLFRDENLLRVFARYNG